MKIYLFLILITLVIYLHNIRENYNNYNNFNNFNIIEEDYIIIGAGPAGLQTAYFLNKYKKKIYNFRKNK